MRVRLRDYYKIGIIVKIRPLGGWKFLSPNKKRCGYFTVR